MVVCGPYSRRNEVKKTRKRGDRGGLLEQSHEKSWYRQEFRNRALTYKFRVEKSRGERKPGHGNPRNVSNSEYCRPGVHAKEGGRNGPLKNPNT